jgi:hypothetical protein
MVRRSVFGNGEGAMPCPETKKAGAFAPAFRRIEGGLIVVAATDLSVL